MRQVNRRAGLNTKQEVVKFFSSDALKARDDDDMTVYCTDDTDDVECCTDSK